MMRKTWRSFALSVLAFLMMFAFPAWPAQAQSLADSLAATIGLNDAERADAYRQLTFPASDLRVGQVLASKPFTVVSEIGNMEKDGYVAEIRVWTGLAERSGQNLLVVWDSIWVDDGGNPVDAFVLLAKEIPDYFSADHQRQFRTVEFAGVYPWAEIPTDPEAASRGSDPLPSDGMMDLYGYGGQVELSAADVALLPTIPSHIDDRPPFTEASIDVDPVDIDGHWAREYILSLMKIGVISGYEDGTIRPNRTLSRAEFVKLLVDAIRETPTAADTGYEDLPGHWSEPYVKAAINAGILPEGKEGASFKPGDPISRAEMAVLLTRSLTGRMFLEREESPTFTDVSELSEQERTAIETSARFGLISGFPDGTFRSSDSLTRAQGFTVISKLIDLW